MGFPPEVCSFLEGRMIWFIGNGMAIVIVLVGQNLQKVSIIVIEDDVPYIIGRKVANNEVLIDSQPWRMNIIYTAVWMRSGQEVRRITPVLNHQWCNRKSPDERLTHETQKKKKEDIRARRELNEGKKKVDNQFLEHESPAPGQTYMNFTSHTP